jgi:hypothetical protein
MSRRRALLCGLALAAGLAGAARGETPEEIFDRGNAAYEQGRFEDAAAAYGTVLRYGIRDPRVHYNLGNAQFKLGNLGQAILNFERARRLDPTDADIRDNLEYARSFCRDQVQAVELPALLGWVRALQDRLGPDRQVWAALALLWAVFGLVAWGLARPGRWNAALGWGLSGLLLALVVVGASGWVTHRRIEGQRLAVVLHAAAEVLAGPGRGNPTLFTVHEGLTIEVRDVREDWVQVSLPNGLHGWLARETIGIV